MAVLESNKKKRKTLNYTWMSGDRYNDLTLTGKTYVGMDSRRMAECICTCGSVSFKRLCEVIRGHVRSCGCLKRAHGMSGYRGAHAHPLYKSWSNMKNRCYQKSHSSYLHYSSRGITVCDEWLRNFKCFFLWAINNGWEEGLTLDREDNDKGYAPNNCRWITSHEQQRNKGSNINITAFGETKCITDWAKDARCSVGANAIKKRIDVFKWDEEEAISLPKMTEAGLYIKKKNSVMLEYNGQIKALKEWCTIYGLTVSSVRNRIRMGWDTNRTLEVKIKKHKH